MQGQHLLCAGTGAPRAGESQGLIPLAPRAHRYTFPFLPCAVCGALCLSCTQHCRPGHNLWAPAGKEAQSCSHVQSRTCSIACTKLICVAFGAEYTDTGMENECDCLSSFLPQNEDLDLGKESGCDYSAMYQISYSLARRSLLK